MEAYCNPQIDYSNLSEILKMQKESLKNIINKFLTVKTLQSYSDLEKIVKKQKIEVKYNFN
jgi:hypothetical protein